MPTERATETHTPNFESGFEEVLNTWRAKWVTTGTGVSRGPTFMSQRVREHMNEEQLAAQNPEDDAYKNMVAYAANGLVQAFQAGNHAEALATLSATLDKGMHVSGRGDIPHVLTDISIRMLDMLQTPVEPRT